MLQHVDPSLQLWSSFPRQSIIPQLFSTSARVIILDIFVLMMFLLQLKKSSFFESSILTGCALLYSTWTFFAVRNMKEICGVLRAWRGGGGFDNPTNIRLSQREHTRTHLTSSEDYTAQDKYLKAHKRTGIFSNHLTSDQSDVCWNILNISN